MGSLFENEKGFGVNLMTLRARKRPEVVYGEKERWCYGRVGAQRKSESADLISAGACFEA